MPQELSETYYWQGSAQRRVVAEDIAHRMLTTIEAAGGWPSPEMASALEARLVLEIMGAFLLHGVECP